MMFVMSFCIFALLPVFIFKLFIIKENILNNCIKSVNVNVLFIGFAREVKLFIVVNILLITFTAVLLLEIG